MVQYTRYKTTAVVKGNVEVGSTQDNDGENRRATDKLFIILPVLVFIIWLGLGIHVLSNKPTKTEIAWNNRLGAALEYDIADIGEENNGFFHTNRYYYTFFDNYTRIMHKTSRIMLYYSTNIPVLMILSALSMYMYMCFLEKVGSKFFVRLSLVLLAIFIFSLILNMRHDLNRFFHGPTRFAAVLCILIKLLNIFYVSTVIYSTLKANVENVAELIKESCRIIVYHPAALLFALLINTLAILVLSFSVIVFNKLLLFNDTEPLLLLFHCANIFGGIFMFNFIMNFGIVVLSDAAARSYQCPEVKIKSFTVLNSMKKTMGNHIGTIAFVSTKILPWIYTLVIMCTHKLKVIENSEGLFIKLFGKLAAMYYMSDFSLILTSTQGYDFKNASRKVLDLIPGNSALYIAGIEVSNFIRSIAESLIFLILFTILHFTIYYDYSHISEYDTICSTIVIVLTIMSVVLSYYLLLKTTVYTFIVHKMTVMNIPKTVELIQ